MDSKRGKKAAFAILRDNKIKSITLDNIVFLLGERGYEIIDYSTDHKEEFDALIDSLQVDSLIFTQNAFTYKKADIKAVFVNEQLSAEEKKYVLAHELGHIECGHLERNYFSGSDVADEYEANEFAHSLLAPSFVNSIFLKLSYHKRIVVYAVIVMVLIGAICGGLLYKKRIDSYHGEYYLTNSGERYHKQNCIYIKEKENVHRLTVEEYESGKYEPCKVCLPEGEEK